MKFYELKQRQKVKDKKTGEVLQVSKRWHGVFLLNAISKKARYELTFGGMPTNENLDWLEPVGGAK